MNELNGPHVVIVLGIRQGRGFDFLELPLLIEASLKGHRIEADPVDPSPLPMVCTELVWETEKREVRKLRSSHVPLRIECSFIQSSGQRVKLGFILLSLRSAAPVTGIAALTLEPKWHRLVSVPNEYRVHKPELSLTLTVRDRVCSPRNMFPTGTVEPNIIGESPAIAETTAVVPIMYLEDGFIQIGHKSPSFDKYLLSIIIGTAVNMDLLLNEDLVFRSSSEKFYITLNILGLSINSKYFGDNLHEPIVINEKIVFKLFTNLEILQLFLGEFKVIPLHFQCGMKLLATANVNVTNLLENQQLQNGVACQKSETSQFKNQNDAFPKIVEGRAAEISVDILLEVLKTKVAPVENILQNSILTVDFSDSTLNASGDQVRPTKQQETERHQEAEEHKIVCRTEEIGVQTTPRECVVTKSSTILKTTPKKQSTLEFIASSACASYILYNFKITFLSITWKRKLEIQGFQFKFLHPKANQALIVNCDLEGLEPNKIMILEDVYCNMHFLSTKDNIKNLISLYPLKVLLQNYENKNLVEDFTIFTKLLKDADNNFDYFAILNELHKNDEPLCELEIEMRLNELGSGFDVEYEESDFNLDPIILDDWLALKTVKELEEWKEKQETLFRDNLKRLECEKLELLQAEWSVKRIELETKLQQGMQKCKILSEELSTAANELRIKKQSLDEKLICSPETRENIEIKVTQMLEEEMNKNVQRIEAKKHELLEKMEQMKEEKINLETQISAKDNELEEMRKTTLTREQTACLLQELRHMEEKFQQAQVEKSFFKQQWRNALMEVHALKSEDQRQIQQNIQRNKEELSQLSLDRLDVGEMENDDVSADFELPIVIDNYDNYRNYYYET